MWNVSGTRKRAYHKEATYLLPRATTRTWLGLHGLGGHGLGMHWLGVHGLGVHGRVLHGLGVLCRGRHSSSATVLDVSLTLCNAMSAALPGAQLT